MFHAGQVIFGAGPAGDRHVLTLRVAGTAGHPYVSIDSVVISGAQAAMADFRARLQPGVAVAPTPTPTPTQTPTPKPTSTAPADPTAQPAPTSTATPAPPDADGRADRASAAGGTRRQVVEFPLSGSQSQFVALMKDMSIDVIEMDPGTYHGWHLFIDSTARPVP